MELYGTKAEPLSQPVHRPAAWFCLSFCLGVFLSIYLLPGWVGLLLGAVVLFWGIAGANRRWRRTALACLGLAAGLWLCWLRVSQPMNLSDRWVGEKVLMTLQVRSSPCETPFGVGLRARVLQPEGLEGVELELYLPSGEEIALGDTLEGVVRLHSAVDSDPKWRYYQYSRGIWLEGSSQSVSVTHQELPWDLYPAACANALGDSLSRLLPEREAGLVQALLTGDRDRLDPEIKEDLSDTGLSHLVAASGLHVHLLMGAVAPLLPAGPRRRGMLLLPLLVFYAALAGFTPSICRAVIMESLFLLGPMLGREAEGITSLSVSLALILVQNPYAAANVGLQLSYAAMTGLLVAGPAVREQLEGDLEGRQGRKYRRFLHPLVQTIAANLLTIPLVLCYFGQISLLIPLSNLLILWILPLLMPLGLAAALAGLFLPWLGQLLAVPVRLLSGGMLWGVERLAELPFGILEVGVPALAWVGLVYVVGGFLWLTAATRRQAALAGFLLLLLLPLLLWVGNRGWEEEPVLSIQILDVGQGQCILVMAEDRTAVIDCGSTGTRAAVVLKNALSQAGREQIDLLILTHYDRDHTNGAPVLLEEGLVQALWLPEPLEGEESLAQSWAAQARACGVSTLQVEEASTAHWAGTQLSCYPVAEPDYRGTAVLICRAGFECLVTGDAGVDAEADLMAQVDLAGLEILVAGHHGSAGSTGTGLLQNAQPQIVVFSVGENRYGHPAQETLDRCLAAGAEIRRTDQNGSIQINLPAG